MNHTAPLPDGCRAIDGGFTANLARIGESSPTCTVCVFSRDATVHPEKSYSMLRDCFAPMDSARRDAAVSEGIRDALRAETDAERLRAPPTGLTTGSVASLLPAWPVAVPARVALQAGVAAAGWAGRISEEPKGAVGFAVGMAAAATAAHTIASRL